MEPELRKLLNRITFSLSILIVWMLINTTIGIKFKYAFWDNNFSVHNFLFYGWLLISTALLLLLLKKIWSKPLNIIR
jgi:hypothetical protein